MAVALETVEPLPKKKLSRHNKLVPLKGGTALPGMKDKRWFGWTRPLKQFLTKNRSWKELQDWSLENNIGMFVTRNLIAWLETSLEAEFECNSRTWVAISRVQAITRKQTQRLDKI